jgi:competence protein ComEA
LLVMHALRKWIRFIFGFSRTETNGFLLLLPIIVLILLSQTLYSRWRSHDPILPDARQHTLDSLVAEWECARVEAQLARADSTSRAVWPLAFKFDPNTATIADLKALGFSQKVAGHVLAYRNKGGKFRVKHDLSKIYGLEPGLYNHLRAYIQLPDSIQRPVVKAFPSTIATRLPATFDINAADTTQLIAIYGIGSRLSRRIIAYREKLGGFVDLAQLKEVYGLDTATVRRLTQKTYVNPGYTPRKLNINLATDRELSTHPYISIGIAKAIVAYRFQHGNFAAVGDICGLQIVKREDADKILPYLCVNP